MEHQDGFGFHFDSNACKACKGKCCRGFGGYVWISLEELEKMAAEKKMDIVLFSKQYVRKIKGRLSLIEYFINNEHFCCFFDRVDCQCIIYESRPRQCRTFPFWNQFKKKFKNLFVECPGVF